MHVIEALVWCGAQCKVSLVMRPVLSDIREDDSTIVTRESVSNIRVVCRDEGTSSIVLLSITQPTAMLRLRLL